eukprot:scaffold28599_cov26-Tisochrysis_lutea.AAC.3
MAGVAAPLAEAGWESLPPPRALSESEQVASLVGAFYAIVSSKLFAHLPRLASRPAWAGGVLLAASSVCLAALRRLSLRQRRVDSRVYEDVGGEDMQDTTIFHPTGQHDTPVATAASVCSDATTSSAGEEEGEQELVNLELNEALSPSRYEPFIACPSSIKVSDGQISPNSPHELLLDESCLSFTRTQGFNCRNSLSGSSAAAAALRKAQSMQQWMPCARSPEDYVPFGSAPPPITGITHDDLCAALVEAISAVKEEANAEREEAVAAVRHEAEQKLHEAVATVQEKAEASTKAAIACAREEWENEIGAAIEEARAAATAEAEARMEAAMVRVHLLMLGSVIVGATISGLIELVGIATKGTAVRSTASAARAMMMSPRSLARR